jgi:hypothetical protein
MFANGLAREQAHEIKQPEIDPFGTGFRRRPV